MSRQYCAKRLLSAHVISLHLPLERPCTGFVLMMMERRGEGGVGSTISTAPLILEGGGGDHSCRAAALDDCPDGKSGAGVSAWY
jgi:hypothetical protein